MTSALQNVRKMPFWRNVLVPVLVIVYTISHSSILLKQVKLFASPFFHFFSFFYNCIWSLIDLSFWTLHLTLNRRRPSRCSPRAQLHPWKTKNQPITKLAIWWQFDLLVYTFAQLLLPTSMNLLSFISTVNLSVPVSPVCACHSGWCCCCCCCAILLALDSNAIVSMNPTRTKCQFVGPAYFELNFQFPMKKELDFVFYFFSFFFKRLNKGGQIRLSKQGIWIDLKCPSMVSPMLSRNSHEATIAKW